MHTIILLLDISHSHLNIEALQDLAPVVMRKVVGVLLRGFEEMAEVFEEVPVELISR